MYKKLPKQITLLPKSVFGPFHAAAYIIKHPSLIIYITIAILLNIVVLLIFAATVFSFLVSTFNSWIAQLSTQLSPIVFGITQITLFILTLLLSALVFSVLSSIVNAPIYGQLAEKVLDIEGVSHTHPRNHKAQFFIDFKNSLVFQLKRTLIAAFLLMISLFLNIIPGIGQVVFVAFNITQLIVLTGLDNLEPAFAREGIRFRNKLGYLARYPVIWPYLVVTGIIVSIPVVNIFTIPLGVTGAILLYTNLRKLTKSNFE